MPSQNSINNAVTNNDFTVTNNDSGGNAFISVSNASNTASSNAILEAEVAGGSGGDAFVNCFINAGQEWSFGLANADSDAFVLAASGALGTNNVFRVDTAGNPTFPANPLNVASGGTTKTSFTAYMPICGGTTTTGALQSLATGTINYVLTYVSSSALPTWQAVSASGAITTIDGDSGSATPSSGVITISGGTTGLTTSASSHTVNLTGTLIVGNGGTGAATLTGLLTGNGTSAITATAITQYNVLTAGASNAPNSVAPSATSGVPLISQGSSAQPIFGTAVVGGGGTGNTTFTAYSVICAGTTATGAFQNVSGVGSANQVLTSNGASALPSWQSISATGAFDQVVIQKFTNSGTYTPTSGMMYCIVECQGSGGAGGGCAANPGATLSVGGGGGAGAYVRSVISAASIGASQTVTIGAPGAGATGAVGGNGATTSVGALISAGGGTGGALGAAAGVSSVTVGGAGSNIGTGTFGLPGGTGYAGFTSGIILQLSGSGGNSIFGQGAVGLNGNSTGNTAISVGAGGGGASGTNAGGGNIAGGNGGAGKVVITEFISS